MKNLNQLFFSSLLIIFVYLSNSCSNGNVENVVKPQSFDGAKNLKPKLPDISDLVNYGKSLGLKSEIKTNETDNAYFKFENSQDAKTMLRLLKNKAKKEELDGFLKSVKFTIVNEKKATSTVDRESLPIGIKQVNSKNGRILNTGCGNWSSAVGFHTGFNGWSSINFGMQTSNGVTSSMNSWLSGFTLGIGWAQHWWSTDRYSDTIQTFVHGVRTYHIGLDSSVVIFSENVSYRILYNCNGSPTVDEINQ